MTTITPRPRPAWIAGSPQQTAETAAVRYPYDGSEVATVCVPDRKHIERAVDAAESVSAEFARLPAYQRAKALEHVSCGIAQRRDEFAEVITAENGKPLKWAEVEVDRAVSVFRIAAEEAQRFDGDLQRLDRDSSGENRMALIRHVPRGPVLAIAPFNFPLNLVAHKVAPALAVGAPVIIKPAARTPLAALMLGELLAETALPAGASSVLPIGNDETSILVSDARLPVVSFTGSGPVGWSIAESAARKHVVLELGGNAAAVVLADWPDLTGAAERIATFGNYQAGQSCIAVQRVIVERAVADEFISEFVTAVTHLGTGDPHDPSVSVGPVIDEAAAERITDWIGEATSSGARILTGGNREGTTVEPTVLIDVPTSAKAWTEEIFGPVLAVSVVDDADAAFAAVNDSAYGLQAGVFTRDIQLAFRASAELRVGGVIIGDVPSYRADHMPYGGTKDSGRGREGVLAAMHDLTEERVTVFTNIAI